MGKIRGFKIVLALALAFPFNAMAGSGVTGDDFLTALTDARPAGMAGSYVATAYGTSALFLNPAGLALLKTPELAASHTSDIYDRSNEQLTAGFPYAGFVFGFSAAYNYTSNFIEVDEFGDERGSVVNYDVLACASAARTLSPDFSAGINLKYFNSFLYNRSKNGFALDLGVIGVYNIYKLGISIQNLGVQSAYITVADPLPVMVRFGIGMSTPVLATDKFTAEAGFCIPLEKSEEKSVNLGAEYESSNILCLRAGLRIYEISGVSIYAGAGAHYERFRFDYSLGSISGSGRSHRVSITYEL